MARSFAAMLLLGLHGLLAGENSAEAHERLRRMLKEIIQRQAEIRQKIRPKADLPERSPDPQIGAVPAITLDRSGRTTVKHTIAWNQYKEDELEIKVVVSDPSLTVPATLKLDFEKHQFRFEYELKVGDKAGEFTVTLTPAAGKSVVVKVTVK